MNLAAISSNTWLGKISRYPLKVLPAGMTIQILQGPLRGKKWIVGSQRHAFWLGVYEPQMQKLIAQEVKPGGIFYDVGANVGFYSLLASKLVGSGRVFAFEPLPANVAYLRRHLAMNAAKNVEVLELAVCDRAGVAFFLEEKTGAMGRLEPGGSMQVSTETLDALVQEQKIPLPNYVKMDIEGAEFKALRGAEACFKKSKPVLFLATHGKEVREQCIDLLQSWKFGIQPIGQGSEERAEILARPSGRL